MGLWIGCALVLAGASAWWGTPAGDEPTTQPASQEDAARAAGAPESVGPRPEPVDYFHPDRGTPVEPAYGGTLRIDSSSFGGARFELALPGRRSSS